MGGGLSNNKIETNPKEITLKQLPESIEESLYIHEKFPLIIDPTDQASRFLKYQNGTFFQWNQMKIASNSVRSSVNRALVSAMQHGRTLTVQLNNLTEIHEEDIFEENLFPKQILSRSTFFMDEISKSVLIPSLGDPPADEFNVSSEFAFMLVSKDEEQNIPTFLFDMMHVIKVIETANLSSKDENGTSDLVMDQITSMYGAKEVIRNSLPLIEAAFDGDLPELQNWLNKGYHIESIDGRKHTPLSEASIQGHIHVVQFLLKEGADPNALNDTGRSPIWRAAFNGHLEVVIELLNAGSNPEFRDKVSMENAYDVAKSEEVRNYLLQWDIKKTHQLMEERKKIIQQNLETRLRTSAEREQYARNLLRLELVEKAERGDVKGIRSVLDMIVMDAEKSGTAPRITAECRNDQGQSLLSIAAQHDHEEVAMMLLSHWKTCNVNGFDIVTSQDEVSVEGKVYKTNANSRDLKGWTCVCIAVFHDSCKVLKLLLENGGKPTSSHSPVASTRWIDWSDDVHRGSKHSIVLQQECVGSCKGDNQYHLQFFQTFVQFKMVGLKDELDAAEHVIKSKAEIRQVLIDFDMTNKSSKKSIFGNGEVVKIVPERALYDGIGNEGNAMVMNIEINNELKKSSKKDKKDKKPNNSNLKNKKQIIPAEPGDQTKTAITAKATNGKPPPPLKRGDSDGAIVKKPSKK